MLFSFDVFSNKLQYKLQYMYWKTQQKQYKKVYKKFYLFYCLIYCMKFAEKRQLKKNLIKFGIWIILLWMSWGYLNQHPAEKISVFSWFEVMFQKAEVFIENKFWEWWELLERKYGMEKYYKELIKMAENNKCISTDVLKELDTLYKNLKSEKKDVLEIVLPEYTKKAYEFDSIVKNDNC